MHVKLAQGEAENLQHIDIQNLTQLLTKASQNGSGMIFYGNNPTLGPSFPVLSSFFLSYQTLLQDAKQRAHSLCQLKTLSASSIILLHFDTHHETIQWLWACLVLGIVPAISTSFGQNAVHRKRHLRHLRTLLRNPLILTTRQLVPEFVGLETELCIVTIDSLVSNTLRNYEPPLPGISAGSHKTKEEIALLMLTSGSTGNAKAVPLRHGQIIQAILSKSEHHGIKRGDSFLNWVGLDHVAALTEIHFHAMSLGSTQVHIAASTLMNEPLHFIELLDVHNVVYTFAPNFFLNKLSDRLSKVAGFKTNLASLKAIISGGESNSIRTCELLSQQLRRFGVVNQVIRSGFGMTETCAGSIYSLDPELSKGSEFTHLGTCIRGMKMRIMQNPTKEAQPGQVGELQVKGSIVFDHYFNDTDATISAFTKDGWFITGDLAWLDVEGNLNLKGRAKDTIILNGLTWSSAEIETAIHEDGISGITPSCIAAISYRPPGSATEAVAIIYSPSYMSDDVQARFATVTSISKIVALTTGQSPGYIIPVPEKILAKSHIGKISRTKIQAEFESGEYDDFWRHDAQALQSYRIYHHQSASSRTEKLVSKALARLLDIPSHEISMDSNIFDLGISSLTLLQLKSKIQSQLESNTNLSMTTILTDPTVGAICSSIDNHTAASHTLKYNPIIPLQSNGSKTPLFCIHPGSGDILVFIALAAHFPTRPVYALRSRGYNNNEYLFRSIDETAETYTYHIRQQQPKGPYAIAGYSLGSTLAFEVAKKLEQQGQEVKFLASIDYPPHIADYVNHLTWNDVLLHVSLFLGLVEEKTIASMVPEFFRYDCTTAVHHILSIADKERVRLLAIDAAHLERVTSIADNFRRSAKGYQPTGSIEQLDVFIADPPSYAARDRQDWVDNRLRRWNEFSRNEVSFHNCLGQHAEMLNPELATDFARIFKAAMAKRGV